MFMDKDFMFSYCQAALLILSMLFTTYIGLCLYYHGKAPKPKFIGITDYLFDDRFLITKVDGGPVNYDDWRAVDDGNVH